MEFSRHNKTAPAIVDLLGQYGSLTANQILQRNKSLARRSVQRVLKTLTEAGVIHIAEWAEPGLDSLTQWAPIYALGKGQNKPPRRRTRQDKLEVQRRSARRRRAQKRLRKRLAQNAGNPFGALIAQVAA